jgi:cobyrinic acid a,c-diamide synthase
VAECGGMLLLGEQLEDGEGHDHPMAGVLPFSARRGVLSLGYREASPTRDGLLVRRGERLTGHEFHRWQLQLGQGVSPRPDLTQGRQGLWQVEGWGSPSRMEGWSTSRLHASWLHLHWAGCPRIPWRLAVAAANAVPLVSSQCRDRAR